jgi:hypothetical protein
VRKALAILLLAVLLSAAVDAIRDHTENRPDAVVPGTETVVRFDVDGYDSEQPLDQGARALWYACNQTVSNHLTDLQVDADGTGVATVTPQLGSHERQRLEGCLKDATIDRIRGDVLEIRDQAA